MRPAVSLFELPWVGSPLREGGDRAVPQRAATRINRASAAHPPRNESFCASIAMYCRFARDEFTKKEVNKCKTRSRLFYSPRQSRMQLAQRFLEERIRMAGQASAKCSRFSDGNPRKARPGRPESLIPSRCWWITREAGKAPKVLLTLPVELGGTGPRC